MEAENRSKGAFLGLAVGDALGAPVEFRPRGTFQHVVDMQPGGYFRLPAGAWTDDTAMAICLAESLLEIPELSQKDLLDRFLRWMNDSENTSSGRCVGIGRSTLQALGNYSRTGQLEAPTKHKMSDGNGAIMRLAPVACVHWRDPNIARKIAIQQGKTTHQSLISSSACDMLAWLISMLISGEEWQRSLQKLASENWHAEIRAICDRSTFSKNEDEISSSGHVASTLEAAIWCVSKTSNFEDALIKAVNLGQDADSVGAVTGQIAGALYGFTSIPQRWISAISHRERLEAIADRLFQTGQDHYLKRAPIYLA